MGNKPLDKDEVVQPAKKSNKIKQDIHKGSWIKSVIKEGKWYLAASMATKALGFFLIPLFTKYLSPADYGVLNTLTTITELLPILLSLSIDVAFVRFYHDYKDDDEKLSALYSSVFWFVLVFGGTMLMLFIFSTYFWFEELLKAPVYPLVYIAFLPALFNQLNQLGIRFLEQSLQARMASIVAVFSAVVNLGLSTLLLVEFELGLIGRIWGITASIIINFIFLSVLFIRSGLLKFLFNRSILREALIYSLPLVLMTASNWINSVSDRLVVAKYVDTSAVGLYSLAFQFAMIVDVFGDAITRVLMPMSMSGLINDKENTKKKLAEYGALMFIFIVFLNIGMLLFSKDVITLMADERYLAAYVAIPILASRKLFGTQYRFYSIFIFYHKKTKYFTIASISTAIANLILNFIFVPNYGYIAAVWSTFVCEIIYAAIIIYFGFSLEKIEVQWRKYILTTIFFLSIIGLHLMVDLSFVTRVFLLLGSTIVLLHLAEKLDEVKNYLRAMI